MPNQVDDPVVHGHLDEPAAIAVPIDDAAGSIPRLLGREQLAPDRGKVGQQEVTSRSAISSSPSRFVAAHVRATSSGATSSFWT